MLATASLMVLTTLRVAAQADPAAENDQPGGAARQSGQIQADEEVTVVGFRTLRDFRIELQTAREKVYGLFNSLNSDDKFDISCQNLPRTGTRIPQRVCRPQYANTATTDASNEFVTALHSFCPGELNETCLEVGRSRAQASVSGVSVGDQQLSAEVQRLTQESPEFRQAIVNYEAVERRYQDARRAEGEGVRVSASVIDAAGAPVPSELAAGDDTAPPKPVETVAPEAPLGGLEDADDREGWVKLRYSVLADGTTAGVSVVDTMPPGLDASSALAAAQSWTFEPATEAGEPLDWHDNLAIVVFHRQRASHAAWPEFAAAYEKVAGLVTSEHYAEAMAQNEQLHELAATLEEMAFAEMQLAVIEYATGDPHAALDAIRRATESSVEQLDDEELSMALQQRFSLEIELGFAVDALETYERRVELGRLPRSDPMERVGSKLAKTLKADGTSLAEQGRIGDDGNWEHALTWPTFAVGDVDGGVSGLEVQCNKSKSTLPFQEDVEMTIPTGWGDCALSVKGPPETTFVVYEFKKPTS